MPEVLFAFSRKIPEMNTVLTFYRSNVPSDKDSCDIGGSNYARFQNKKTDKKISNFWESWKCKLDVQKNNLNTTRESEVSETSRNPKNPILFRWQRIFGAYDALFALWENNSDRMLSGEQVGIVLELTWCTEVLVLLYSYKILFFGRFFDRKSEF